MVTQYKNISSSFPYILWSLNTKTHLPHSYIFYDHILQKRIFLYYNHSHTLHDYSVQKHIFLILTYFMTILHKNVFSSFFIIFRTFSLNSMQKRIFFILITFLKFLHISYIIYIVSHNRCTIELDKDLHCNTQWTHNIRCLSNK